MCVCVLYARVLQMFILITKQIFSVNDRINFSNEILNNLRVPNWVDYIADTLLNRVSLSLLVSFCILFYIRFNGRSAFIYI